MKFFKGMNEKFFERGRFNRYEEELRDLTNLVYNEVKAFLNLTKL